MSTTCVSDNLLDFKNFNRIWLGSKSGTDKSPALHDNKFIKHAECFGNENDRFMFMSTERFAFMMVAGGSCAQINGLTLAVALFHSFSK